MYLFIIFIIFFIEIIIIGIYYFRDFLNFLLCFLIFPISLFFHNIYYLTLKKKGLSIEIKLGESGKYIFKSLSSRQYYNKDDLFNSLVK